MRGQFYVYVLCLNNIICSADIDILYKIYLKNINK
jgi:hypothetical protein